MNGLDRLQKEIDALTYNARTVLNALIRSVTAAGNNKGFNATRADETIYLSRIDIYRIYKFYEEWQANDFATEDNLLKQGFTTILANHDATPVTVDGTVTNTKATTSALVNHSKILFQTTANKDNTDTEWLDLIKNNNNAKLVSNSAPIPLNLRTPIFDENLSTAHYNSHPTYLFPSGYFTIDLLGYSGDDTNHELGGKSWTINSDDFIRLNSKKISLGGVIPEATYKIADKRTGEYALSFGYDSHAQAKYSVAGGFHSMVPVFEEDSIYTAIAIGTKNIASRIGSTSIGGYSNSVSNKFGAILGGSLNKVTAEGGGILGGKNNIVGGKVYTFTVQKNSDNELVYNSIMINGNLVTEFTVLSSVMLFDFTFISSDKNFNYFWETNGDAIQARENIIASASYKDSSYTLVTLNTPIPNNLNITGGSISIVNSNNINLGKYSGAIGSNLIAEGESQLVVGKYNKIQRNARFIVGNGITYRSNSFEVYDTGFIAYTASANNQTFDINKSPAAGFTGMRFGNTDFDILIGKNRLTIFKDRTVTNLDTIGFEYSGKIGETDEFSIKAGDLNGINLITKKTTTNITLLNDLTGLTTEYSIGTGASAIGNVNILSANNVYIQGKTGVSITGGSSLARLYVNNSGFNATFNGTSLLTIDPSTSVGTTIYSRMTFRNTLNTVATEFTIDNTDIAFNDPDVIIRLKNSAATGYTNTYSMSFIAYEHPTRTFAAGNVFGTYWGIEDRPTNDPYMKGNQPPLFSAKATNTTDHEACVGIGTIPVDAYTLLVSRVGANLTKIQSTTSSSQLIIDAAANNAAIATYSSGTTIYNIGYVASGIDKFSIYKLNGITGAGILESDSITTKLIGSSYTILEVGGTNAFYSVASPSGISTTLKSHLGINLDIIDVDNVLLNRVLIDSTGVNVSGYTKLGSDAPAIKMKLYEGTLDTDSLTNVPHGLDWTKIIAITGVAKGGDVLWTGPDNSATNYEYNLYWTDTNIVFNAVGTQIQSKAYKVILTYIA